MIVILDAKQSTIKSMALAQVQSQFDTIEFFFIQPNHDLQSAACILVHNLICLEQSPIHTHTQ